MTAARTPASQHATWLSLLEASGPFLSASVLADSDGFRQGLPRGDNEPTLRATFASYYTQWLDNRDRSRPDPAIDRAWFDAVVHDVLEWDGFALEGQSIPPGLTLIHGETREMVSPDLVLRDDEGRNRLLLQRYPAHQDLTAPIANAHWVETPAIRMVALLQETGVRLGLVTNGEAWLLVSAPAGEAPGFATWLASLWFEEHDTFTAFRTLLGIQRFVGVPEEETLERLLDRSAEDHSGVTTRLGDQVRQAIELLVEGIDLEDETRNGALLAEVPDEQVYEAAIAVMMRLVFLLYAEDQQPPLIGGLDATYEESYSVAGLIERLETVEEAVLEQRRDAWPRLLATFRLVHAGSDHDRMRQPAYGGSLFDPDRFPFLEGRQQGTTWRDIPAQPLPITNRTVLHMLQAIQFLENRGGRERISFRALDVEQIGHIYEQLLEHTAKRAVGPVLGFSGTKRKEPEIALADLEAWHEAGETELLKRLKEATGRSESALKRLLAAQPDRPAETTLRRACHNDDGLVARVRPFAALIRKNRAGRPVVIHPGGLYVTAGNDRGTTGAHYTPRTLTEPIVQYTLEPLVYDGPAEGQLREEWRLLPPKAILALNVCDPAMGSGAFLVQACRWLAKRLVESWTSVADAFEPLGKPLAIAADGTLSQEAGFDATLLPADPTERLAIARRLVADHCLYGVDVNPLAVDMAKLSLWLVTLQKNQPFTFLDHRLRAGDSLLGLGSLDQLRAWSLSGETAKGRPGFTTQFDRQVKAALDRGIELHRKIEETRVLDVHDIERQEQMLKQAEQLLGVLALGGDLLTGAALADDRTHRDALREQLQPRYSVLLNSLENLPNLTPEGRKPVLHELQSLREEASALLGDKCPFHWALEFPEVFLSSSTHDAPGGFSAIVGNPPFMAGTSIGSILGGPYLTYLGTILSKVRSGGRGDFAAYFLLRSASLLHASGSVGLITTNSIAQGDTREIGLTWLLSAGFGLMRATSSRPWPGHASVFISEVWLSAAPWAGEQFLDGRVVRSIASDLTEAGRQGDATPFTLLSNLGIIHEGSKPYGQGFVVSHEDADEIVRQEPGCRDVLFPYVIGRDINSELGAKASRWIIDFRDRSEDEASQYQLCYERVRTLVKPERATKSANVRAAPWWRHFSHRPELYAQAERSTFVIARSRVSSLNIWAVLNPKQVFSEATVAIPCDSLELFAVLQSSIHEVWITKYASTMKGDTRYTPTDVFATFPFPRPIEVLDSPGSQYLRTRDSATTSVNLSLGSLFRKIDDLDDESSSIAEMRSAIVDLDHAIITAYGWDDLDLEHGFHETKQGIRFTISEIARREVLDRLLELNQQRYAEEVAQGLHDKGAKKAKRTRAKQQSLL